jgi:SAM-dependent MidA family methyltransferase
MCGGRSHWVKRETLHAYCPASNSAFLSFGSGGRLQAAVCQAGFGVERFLPLNTELADFIRQNIRAHGPQPFSWFMQQALYHPEHGYYSSGRAAIGRKGDYFTNVTVGPLFGRLLCAQFAEIWKKLDRIDSFIVTEQGAHDGQFARDVLECAQKCFPDFFAALCYRIVEPFPLWRDRQHHALASFREKIEWREKIDPFTGIHFSNELLDAMPVDLPGQLVDLYGDDFVLVPQKAEVSSPPPLNQFALDWLDEISKTLQNGYILMVDYGQFREDFQPNIQIRARHQELASPFEQIGHADITAHVDWKSIVSRARHNGLHIGGFTDQHHFLMGIISQWPGLMGNAKENPALQTLLHPEMLGRSFQVVALEKNVDPGAGLAGFRFARASEL